VAADGNHIVGGEIPDDLTLPACEELTTPFQYLGTIDATDPFFSWMGIPHLHVTYPLLECNWGVYLDYTDPSRPQIVNPETFSGDWYDEELSFPDECPNGSSTRRSRTAP